MPMSGAGQSNMAATEIRHWLSRMKRDQIIAAFDAARFYDGRRHLASLDVPTLVVVGSDNSATHRGARLFADTIEDAAFMMLEGGHMLHTDNPQGLRGAIEQFVDERLIGSAVNEKMTR